MNFALKDGEDFWFDSPKMLTRLMTVMFMLFELKVSTPALCDSSVERFSAQSRLSPLPDGGPRN